MPLWLLNIWGWAWAHKRLVLIVVGAIALVIMFGLIYRSCGKSKTAKVDLETVDKINSKNAAEARQDVRDMVEENLAVTTAVDNRTVLAEANAVERDRLIEEKIKVVNQKIAEAKSQGQNVTQEDLQCLLVPSDCS